MEGEGASEFHDWEVLHDSNSPVANSSDSSRTLEGIEGDSEGVIRSDYFSLNSEKRYLRTTTDVSEEGSVESDNPSWIDPGPETRYGMKNSGGSWSDSSSDLPETRKLGDFDAKQDVGFVGNPKSEVGFEEIEEIQTQKSGSGQFWSDFVRSESDFSKKLCSLEWKNELGSVENEKGLVGFEGIEVQTQGTDSGNVCLHSDAYGSVPAKFGDVSEESEIGVGGSAETQEGLEVSDGKIGGSELVMEFGQHQHANGCGEEERTEVSEENDNENQNERVAVSKEIISGGEEGKRRIVWWKVPLELVKFCIFRVSPIWSFSVAAAVMGFVLFGRRLYKMKRKSQSLQLKVTVDDKKVSQFMSRAARLNEAFSVVRRVPVVRPALPAGGVASWPVMSLR